jgi:hypothetical protein
MPPLETLFVHKDENWGLASSSIPLTTSRVDDNFLSTFAHQPLPRQGEFGSILKRYGKERF